MISDIRELPPIQRTTSSVTDSTMGVNSYLKHPLGGAKISPKITSWASIFIYHQGAHKIWNRVLELKKRTYCSRIPKNQLRIQTIKIFLNNMF